MTCKDCLYYEVCPLGLAIKGSTGICLKFKNKSDYVEVKRGEWLNIVYTQRYRCSLCENEIYFGKDKFCSECGAKMDGMPKERGGDK